MLRASDQVPVQVRGRTSPDDHETFAASASSAVAELTREVERLERDNLNLQQALENRPHIEHVLGMLMLLMSCDADTAWRTLARISQDTNCKVNDITEAVARSVSGGGGLSSDLAAALHLAMPGRGPMPPRRGPRTG